ncbi:short transient receptor potential channel 5-like [Strongylocentrotus purpuratus]|uniref:Transient receptor ion channel domain-containing protein n=1 Tax=Strongylocentrotus purpuratus TaxID=7668 RepID=A0A7M7PQM1_STRPU|nr:short transient receptor potential channel 5-like [Strongylocentrotus purpuratus]
MELDIGPGRFDSMEKLFLAAAEKGDKKAILYALDNAPDLNINSSDKDGRSALVIAIQNGNSDIIVVLLEHGIQLGDALLRAVDEQFIYAEFLKCRALNGDFHPDITPIVLAAHHNNYDIIKILLEYGARIEDPEYYAFSTETNTLQHSLGMLNIYRALASQAYISLTSLDPINTGFERCVKLRKLCQINPEFSVEFNTLAGQCEQFAADILGHIRNQAEQTCVLYHDPCFYSIGESGIGPYKVKIAIHHEQRKFVAHPHCQQHLTQLWYEGLPSWYMTNWISSTLSTSAIGFGFPILCLLYIIYPWGNIGRLMRVPHVQFVCHISSMLVFLLLLGLQSSFTPKYDDDPDVDQRAEVPKPTEWLILVWVIGLTWVEIKELWYYGSRYLKDRWNILDFFTLSLYWAAIALRIVIYRRHGMAMELMEIPPTTMLYSTMEIPTAFTDDEFTTSGETPVTVTDPATTMEMSNWEAVIVRIERLHKDVMDIDEEQTDIGQSLAKGIGDIKSQLTLMDERMAKIEAESEAAAVAAPVVSGGRRGKKAAAGTATNTTRTGRANWSAYDPLLISEGLFAIAKVLSFLRPICYTVMNRHVGPMQISLGNMMFDICKFLLIFCFVWFAFSLGMNQLYGYYSYITRVICDTNNPMEEHCKQPFETVQYTMSTLFWALFGLPEMNIVDIRGVDHEFTETVGLMLYAAYHVIAIVVLLNVLIAMMSNTYTRIEDDSEVQWKFSRSKLWMSYFAGRGSLPAPFNVLPTPKSMLYLFRWLRGKLGSEKHRQEIRDRNKAKMEEKEQQYREIMGKLVKRYIFDAKRDEDENNQEQWVNRLKQDISGFKYEMFEALTGMDKKMSEMEQRIEDGGVKEPGTQMFHKMEDVVKRPLYQPDSMQSVISGCSDLMTAASKDLMNSKGSNNADNSPILDDGLSDPSTKNRRQPKSTSMPCNIAGYLYPPDWEKNEPILFMDEDPDVPILGGPPRKESKKRRFSANHMMNHIGSRHLKRKKSHTKNTTRV